MIRPNPWEERLLTAPQFHRGSCWYKHRPSCDRRQPAHPEQKRYGGKLFRSVSEANPSSTSALRQGQWTLSPRPHDKCHSRQYYVVLCGVIFALSHRIV